MGINKYGFPDETYLEESVVNYMTTVREDTVNFLSSHNGTIMQITTKWIHMSMIKTFASYHRN